MQKASPLVYQLTNQFDTDIATSAESSVSVVFVLTDGALLLTLLLANVHGTVHSRAGVWLTDDRKGDSGESHNQSKDQKGTHGD